MDAGERGLSKSNLPRLDVGVMGQVGRGGDGARHGPGRLPDVDGVRRGRCSENVVTQGRKHHGVVFLLDGDRLFDLARNLVVPCNA